MKNIPAELGEYVRNRTDWDKFTKILQEQAFGGVTIKNANNVTYTTQPDMKAMNLLVEISYGKLDADEELMNTIKKEISEQAGPPQPLKLAKTG